MDCEKSNVNVACLLLIRFLPDNSLSFSNLGFEIEFGSQLGFCHGGDFKILEKFEFFQKNFLFAIWIFGIF